MDLSRSSNKAGPKARLGGSRDATIEAAGHLERALASSAWTEPPAWRLTLYNKFARKEDIFRENVGTASESASPGIEFDGENALRVIAHCF
jgi:TetR/AcrR family transcriptional regulator of autoinduction and epiphytic fitness